MIAVTVLGAPAWLVPYGPNTKDVLKLTASLEVDTQRSLTGRSTRRPQAFTNRYQQSWISMMKPEDFQAARAAILSANDEPVVVPFYLAARKTTQAAAMTGGLTVAWKRDWSSYAINPGSLAGYDYFAPLLMGAFTQPPRLTSKNTDYVLAEFVCKEDSPAAAAIQPPLYADATLATPDGYAATVFPFSPEYSNPAKLTFGQVDVERQPIGPGRQTAEIYYPQARETFTQPSFKLKTSTDIVALLAWWQRRSGQADAFWVPTTQKIGDLTADLPSGSTTIPTVAPMSVKVGDTLALVTTGLAPEYVRISSIVSGVPHLSAPTNTAHSKLWTVIVPALLAHHSDTELSIDVRRGAADWIGDVTLGFRELVPEYAATDGEVRGTTVGKLPGTAWLARIDLDYSGAMQSTFITDYEGGCTTADAQVWEYHPNDFDKIALSKDLEDDQMGFTVRWWSGCPWENWRVGQLAAIGTITILKATVASDGTVGLPSQIWQGNLSTPTRDGPIYNVTVFGLNQVFSQLVPAAQMTPTCWKRFCGALCRLSLSDWIFNAVVSATGAHTLTVNTITRANGSGLPAGFGFQDWFALGFVQWTDGSGRPLRAEVIGSTALAGGAITLTLGRTLGWSIGSAVQVVPWCDKRKETCSAYDAVSNPTGKFNNFTHNFGGFWQMPAVSPNFVIPNTTSTPAKK